MSITLPGACTIVTSPYCEPAQPARSFLTPCFATSWRRATRCFSAATWILESVIESEEFRLRVLHPLREDRAFPDGRFAGQPSLRQRLWASDELDLGVPSRTRAEQSATWPDLLNAIFDDPIFVRMVGRPEVKKTPT